MNSRWKIIICIFLSPLFAFAQKGPVKSERLMLSLPEVISLAKAQSPASYRAQTRMENRYWQYNTYLSNYRPQLVLSGGEEFSREVIPTRQNDGTYAFPQVNQNYAALALSLEQRIGFSGSRIFLSSSLNRFDNFFNNEVMYSGQPVFIGITQPLFFFNWLKWDKKIEPLRYEESKREYVEEMEEISVRVTNLFFDLLLAQATLTIAENNLENNEALFKTATESGDTTENAESELLQLELSVMRARQQLAKAALDLETSTLKMKSYIGMNNGEVLMLIPPADIPEFNVDTEVALAEASKNRQASISFERKKLEAEREVARARGNSGFSANLNATFGLTNQGEALEKVYQQPDDQQAVVLNFSLPVMDWGRRKSRMKTAAANQELTEFTVAQERINFEQEVITQVRLFEMLREQVKIAERSDDIAQRRYQISRKKFVMRQISLTDLNIAAQEKDEAKRSYVAALRDFWKAYYELRQLTLYDFERMELLGR
ncbi:MAG: TolC family protein [Bacteroidetes bacterium]|nr:TolC family protein [Bacteroidota bacterium]